MQAMPAALRAPPRDTTVTVVDYVSPDSPTVTHVRGSVIVASIALLKTSGLYERYLARLSPVHRDALVYAISASWLPIDAVMAHCAGCDAMGLSEQELNAHGEMIAKHVGESLFGAIFRGARAIGVHDGWWLARQTDRTWPRTYRGGGCTVLQTGPKDLIFEVHGLPMLTSRFYRASHHGYMKGFARMLSTAHFVKAVRPREPHPQRAATGISFV